MKPRVSPVMRAIITKSATRGKTQKSKVAKILQDLDDIALSRAVRVAEEGMRGYRA